MELLIYNELHPKRNATQFERVCKMLEAGNFAQAEVKKLHPTNYFRAKLTDSDRLLFSFVQYKGERYILLLEILYNHAYESSRFLNGSIVDENKIAPLRKPEDVNAADIQPLKYRNPGRKTFHFLDRPLSFDELQENLYSARLPMILVGSAGSGKTVLSLEKLKTLSGNILYVTRSSYLADNARRLYFSAGYDNQQQEVDFLSFDEFAKSIRAPEGRPAEFTDFQRWFRDQPHRNEFDAYQLYEEFFGVVTGHDVSKPYLTEEDYLALGIKQSIFPAEKRKTVYAFFLSWLAYMQKEKLYEDTIQCFDLLKSVREKYDWLVVDEVQDLTNVQLFLTLKSLKNPHSFLLCGDSNQIVHPNFFSWSSVKTLFFSGKVSSAAAEIKILHANYRNSIAVTETANQILRLKVSRFGSVDRESNFLVDCTSDKQGEVKLLQDSKEIRRDLNEKTANSVHFAVIVLRETDKAAASQIFKTPLIFSVREAKGLEYSNVIVFNLVGSNRSSFDTVAEGVDPSELSGELKYSRNKDKSDKSLEIYKFFINSMYVAVTRAVENIYWIEQDCRHPLFRLLKLNTASGKLDLKASASTADEWRKEAAKLAAQGKKEQSAKILSDVLKIAPVPWEVITREKFPELVRQAIGSEKFNSSSKLKLQDYAYAYAQDYFFVRLAHCGVKNTRNAPVISGHYRNTYEIAVNPSNRKNLRKKIDRYGVDFRDELNRTPLMLACDSQEVALMEELLNMSANPVLQDNYGRTAFHYLLNRIATRGWIPDMAKVYQRLAPGFITVRENGREIKIDSRKAEFFIFHFLWSLPSKLIVPEKDLNHIEALSAQKVFDMTAKLPEFIMPEYRKKRQYSSAILSKNEMNSTNHYGLHLFYRFRQGQYILNPFLELNYNGKWYYWDELAAMNFWIYPLYNNAFSIMNMLIYDLRSRKPEADIKRSTMLCCVLKHGYPHTADKIFRLQGFPEVTRTELQEYADEILKIQNEIVPMNITEADENSKSVREPPYIYPGEKLERTLYRNYKKFREQVQRMAESEGFGSELEEL